MRLSECDTSFPCDSNELCLYLWLQPTILIMVMLTFGASLVCDSATPTPHPSCNERAKERERSHGKDLWD